MIPQAPAPSEGHLRPAPPVTDEIPQVVEQTPILPPPQALPDTDTYTVVVNDVPVKELLFALARDASLNIDVAEGITGNVTLNAIEQTLPQILERLSRQVDLRWEVDNGTLVVTADTPFYRTYDVGYVNMSRDVETVVNVATKVATTGEGAGEGGGGAAAGNTSSTRLNAVNYNRFWETLTANILAILGQSGSRTDRSGNQSVVVNAEAGIINVLATQRQHELIQGFIDQVLVNAHRQVLIEATIVEVRLNDQYQAGVDWRVMLDDDKSGFGVNQSLLGAITDGIIDQNISSFVFGYRDPNNNGRLIDVTIRALQEFGDTRVLSSPRLMVLNNQTAMLKVVEELVYFTIDVNITDAGLNAQARTDVESEVHTVPVGVVMTITPQISENDEVSLNIRPTISQRIGDAIDPGPRIIAANSGTDPEAITNLVPIIRVREMESVLKVSNGRVAVLGGLMQDEVRTGKREVPGLARIPLIGDLFFDTDEIVAQKAELIIFLRPVVVRDPSLEGDLGAYRPYLGGAVDR
jgi:general secretion pathway protein D